MQDLAQFIANHMALSYIFATALVLLVFIEFLRARRNKSSIDTSTVVNLINRDNAIVLDIRSDALFKAGHIIDSYSFKASDLMADSKPIEKFNKRPLVVVCNNGFDSQKLAAFLLRNGYNAYSLAGGMRSWSEAELPLVKD